MNTFALVVHPMRPKRDVARQYPLLGRILPTPLIHVLARYWPPVALSRVAGLRSTLTGERAEGWLLACPLTATQILRLPPQTVYDRIVQTGRLAQRQGARIVGLGALTAAAGDGGVTVAQRLSMPVTTGNSLTVGLAVEWLRETAKRRGLDLESATAAVVGASGSVGLASAEMLSSLVHRLILVGQRELRLSQARAEVEAAGGAEVSVSTEMAMVAQADLVLSATNAAHPVLYPRHLKNGALVCDVALPHDVASAVRLEREDVVMIDGVTARAPGSVDFGFDLGFPRGRASACMAETMVLALAGRYESFSLGRRVYPPKVREIVELAREHGFRWEPGRALVRRRDA